MNDFGSRLRQLRIEKQMTQEELGKILGKSKNNISQYETNKRQADDETKKQLAYFFNVSIDYLLGRSDIKNPDELLDHNNKLVTVLYDEEMQAAFKDYDSWTVEDKKELIAYLNAKRVMRENKDK